MMRSIWPEGAGAENEIAEAALPHQHFGGDQRPPAIAHAEPQPDDDARQRARQIDVGDQAQPAGAERAQRQRVMFSGIARTPIMVLKMIGTISV